MISIKQRELLHFRQVAAKTFGRLPRGKAVLEFHGSDSGLTMMMRHADVVLRYRSPEPQSAMTSVSVDVSLLRSLEKNVDEGIVLRPESEQTTWEACITSTRVSRLAVHPVDAGVIQQPQSTMTADKRLLARLADCVSMSDTKSVREAFHCIQLNGHAKTAAATDGRKALLIKCCPWPWTDERLVPATGWFGSPVVQRAARDVRIDDLGDSVIFAAGPWSVELPFESHRFPDVPRVFPARWQADTIVRWIEDDRRLLSDFLKSTRGTMKQDSSAITLEAATMCSARVGDADGSNVQEVALPHAARAGVPFIAALPRHALTDFVRLGFDELLVTERAETFWSYDGNRQFVFRPLSGQFAVFPRQGASADKEAVA